jgi:chromosomal replication initiator protein
MGDIWTEALRGLQPRLGSQTFDMWLRPIQLQSIEGDLLRLSAPNRFLKEWFETHYLQAVLDELLSLTKREFRVEIDVVAEPVPEVVMATGPVPPPAETELVTPPEGLSPRYRFGSFIKGASNEVAASAAMAVAEEPGQRFNPLFIYGGVGLGKTHLLHAVGHALHERRPTARVVYLNAERFMNEFVTAVRHNQFDEFRARYRNRCDVLLVDDIQFIAGRDRTMDEFFHVFNALYEAGKQIMVTADHEPTDIEGMEERLTSRLNWGLVADIKPPDLETRVAILRQKAEADGIGVASEVTLMMANLVRSNVRELEGALLRVATFASLKGVPITEDFVREVLKKTVDTAPPKVTVEAVQKAVAHYFSVRIADLKGSRRHRGIVRPRQIAMYLARTLAGASFPDIGLRFGKDHSTVQYACRRIQAMSESDADVKTAIATVKRQLVGDAEISARN